MDKLVELKHKLLERLLYFSYLLPRTKCIDVLDKSLEEYYQHILTFLFRELSKLSMYFEGFARNLVGLNTSYNENCKIKRLLSK